MVFLFVVFYSCGLKWMCISVITMHLTNKKSLIKRKVSLWLRLYILVTVNEFMCNKYSVLNLQESLQHKQDNYLIISPFKSVESADCKTFFFYFFLFSDYYLNNCIMNWWQVWGKNLNLNFWLNITYISKHINLFRGVGV